MFAVSIGSLIDDGRLNDLIVYLPFCKGEKGYISKSEVQVNS